MLLLIALMFLGVALGYIVFSRFKTDAPLKIVGRVQWVFTTILLFIMGLWLGGNNQFWDTLLETGISGLVFCVLSILGSVLVVFLFDKLFFRRRKR